jgi:hypothetical protein
VQRYEKDEKLDAAPTAKSEAAKPAQGVKAVEEKGRSCKMREVWVIEKESNDMQTFLLPADVAVLPLKRESPANKKLE